MRNLFYFVISIIILFLGSCENKENPIELDNNNGSLIIDTLEEKTTNLIFGFSPKDYNIYYDTVQHGWTLSHILLPYGLSQHSINQAATIAKDSAVALNYVVKGKPFIVFTEKGDTLKRVKHLVYQPDVFSYITFTFMQDSISVFRHQKDVEYKERRIFGEIEQNSNLSSELNKHFDSYNMTAAAAFAIEGVFAWSIDFFKLQAGDKFVVIFDEKAVDDIPYSIDKIKYMWFNHAGKGMYAFHYTTDSVANISGYYDEKGNEMKRPFLMSPVKFSRISSSYNLNRIHPIYKTRRAHLGTDYAAPTGTPILATADGTVSKASRSKGNGIYVKIRHNSVYETQYLHMSKIADGIRPRVRVTQGQVIGYVGATGAATGPHVCYRFWKNGRQINHRTEQFPDSEPMDEELIPTYLEFIQPLKKELDKLIEQTFSLANDDNVSSKIQ